jgi:hypothetical protein
LECRRQLLGDFTGSRCYILKRRPCMQRN